MKISAINSYPIVKTAPKKRIENRTQYNSLPPPNYLDAASNPLYYGVNFTGAYEKENLKNFKYLKSRFTPFSQEIYSGAEKLAAEFGHKEITRKHLLLSILNFQSNFIEDMDNGALTLETSGTYGTPYFLATLIGIPDLYKDAKQREKLQKVNEKYMTKIANELAQMPSSPMRFSSPKINKDLAIELSTFFEGSDIDEGTGVFSDPVFIASFYNSRDKESKTLVNDYIFDAQKALMVNPNPQKEKHHLNFFDDKADKLWKNLDLGYDVFVTHDTQNVASVTHLLSSFVNLIKKPGQAYNTLSKDNVKVTIFNSTATFPFMEKMAEEAKKDKDTKHIFIFSFEKALQQSAIARGSDATIVTLEDKEFLENKDSKNLRLIGTISDASYFANTETGAYLANTLRHFSQIPIPLMSAKETKEVLKTDSGRAYILKETKKEFEDDAIDRIVDFTNQADGIFPDKAITQMAKISSRFIDSELISLQDVEQYEQEDFGLRKTSENEGMYNIVFDTKKGLDDIIGTAMTKAEAKSVVDLIQRGKKGITRGYTTYLENGSSYGGGRRHSAEAIAGEAQIPMITINARDFALKDIDALSQSADLSEVKIKKIVNAAKTQAEANRNKTAMIFIENFDNFGSDPLYGVSSIYEQKAFSQLLTEMENIRRNDDVNIIVVGSTNRPEYLDENIMKPYKFLDQIVVYPPQDDQDRMDVLNYYADKMGLEIAGETPQEKTQVVRNVAETTSGFSVVDLMYLLEKADDISKQRGKDAIDKSDFTEAFLQTTTGRVNTRQTRKHENKLLAMHECGHAITLQTMYNIAQTQDKPWHLPSKVNFVTLDPRGSYAGAMYPKTTENDEYSFEKIFADIICDFGGHASEKRFFNMDGSWGITQDMNMATGMAKTAVQIMGMGPKTGKISIGQNGLGLTDASNSLKERIDSDVEVFLKNAEVLANKIVQSYEGFIELFAQKYADKVGTGDCIIMADEFNEMLNSWIASLPKDKKEELRALDKEILQVIEQTKKGELVK